MSGNPLVGGETYFQRPLAAIPTPLLHTFEKYIQPPHKPYPVDFSVIDIRVGRILGVSKNPHNSKALEKSYICRVKVGWERGPRVIVSELAQYYTREQLKLKKVVVLCNIPPERSFGQKSWGWILAAETSDGDLELLQPPMENNESDQVTVWGFPPVEDIRDEPDLNVKQLKKLFKDMRINSKGEAEWQGYPMCVEGGYNPIIAGNYARDTPIVNAVKKRTWKKYKFKSASQLRRDFREFIE